ncbi:hypothetical protein IEC97_01700 [Neobacillus cucumis]|uniref:hypothetical protein n=1 Tax=Neobacillus cucumis TaxID=1740721 RepID=UPI0018DFE3A0|nr:hypothetical protein [Neobacillus cucumis]MBI0576060.1 hypothetical protein [Neobacillus cucumis]WHY90250.1 hypothetical protein QNK12_21595 [Neobacillus cucumis]
MFRFSIDGEDWILRFSPNLQIETDEKQEIMLSILHIGNQLSNFSHGEAFIMFSKKIGAIVFEVERIPSFILTVSNIIEEDHWYIQDTTIQLKRKL